MLRRLFLEIAAAYGVRDDVAALIKGKTDPACPDDLGEFLRETREEKGLTLQDVRDRCHMSRSQLSFYENGIKKNPPLRTTAKLARGYGVPLWQILTGSFAELRLGFAPGAKVVRRRRRAGK